MPHRLGDLLGRASRAVLPLALIGLALGVPNAAPAGAAAAATPTPYLAGAHDFTAMIGPPPESGSGALAGDIQTFETTRSLRGGTRWALATQDDQYGPAALMRAFSCPLTIHLDPQTAPHLFQLLNRVSADSNMAMTLAKQAYKRPRPFVEHPGPICVPDDEAYLRSSPSYPSGHSTLGWAAGLILSEIAPDASAAILARARAYGESRIVCGVHYPSDVEAGRMTGAALVASLDASAEFRRDLAVARQELRALRRRGDGLSAAECAAASEAMAHPVW